MLNSRNNKNTYKENSGEIKKIRLEMDDIRYKISVLNQHIEYIKSLIDEIKNKDYTDDIKVFRSMEDVKKYINKSKKKRN